MRIDKGGKNSRKKRIIIIIILIICIAIGIPPGGNSNNDSKGQLNFNRTRSSTIIVDQNGSGNYLTINAASNNADNGDIIKIYDGIYYEDEIRIRKSISIIGNGTNTVIVPSNNNVDYIFGILSDNVSISDIYFLDDNNYLDKTLSVSSYSNITFNNITIEGGEDGIHLSKTKNAILNRIKIYNCTGEGIQGGRIETGEIINSAIHHCSERGISISGDDLTIKNNSLYNSSFSFYEFDD
ncbi:MAG: hypothetical protein GF411_20110, partial [Candidatus Lokiarchaeota archaeon]|nr:hypothetical protein [Candidatus Lokiarchaeota archaeon]